jgi:hypothetical protein
VRRKLLAIAKLGNADGKKGSKLLMVVGAMMLEHST